MDFNAFPNLGICVVTREASLRQVQPMSPQLDVKIT